jgi:hypothetical protein
MEDRQDRGRGPSVTTYPKLIAFFEEIIANPRASIRVRLTAATRLDAILTRIERREAAEARRAERDAVQAARARERAIEHEQPAAGEMAARDIEREQAAERARQNLGKILQKS